MGWFDNLETPEPGPKPELPIGTRAYATIGEDEGLPREVLTEWDGTAWRIVPEDDDTAVTRL
jgi:hypothetical protein